MLIGLLFNIVNASNYIKCVSLSNQECTTQHTPINLHFHDYTQGLSYYQFTVNLDRWVGSCSTFNDISNKVCASNKAHIFNIIKGINESKELTEHVLCKCECKDDVSKCNSNQEWNNNKCWCKLKNLKEYYVCNKYIFGILLHVVANMINN